MDVPMREAWREPFPEDAPKGCTGRRQPEGGAGITEVAKRGTGPSLEMPLLEGAGGDVRRQRGQCRCREAWQGPTPGRYTIRFRRQETIGGGVGVAVIGRRGKAS